MRKRVECTRTSRSPEARYLRYQCLHRGRNAKHGGCPVIGPCLAIGAMTVEALIKTAWHLVASTGIESQERSASPSP